MKYIYAPGCALMSYKPHLADKLKEIADQKYGQTETLLACCFNKPDLEPGTCIITPCATCAQNYVKGFPECTSSFFLSELADSEDFPFPDYGGVSMSIQDTCTAKTQPEVMDAIRKLLKRMNINLVEPAFSGKKSKCCGQIFYGKLSTDKVEDLMTKRAEEMPCEDVVVYCASCIMSMTVGGKRPRYIVDLLFGEPTDLKISGADEWNGRLRNFRESHK